jgi:dipeptidyl aminopeptidase/acylaminoacyl peptidase
MALQTGIQYANVVSVVTWGGVSDMSLTYSERDDLRKMMKRVIGGTPKKYPDRYEYRTPLFELDRLKAPLLIIHGLKDQNVSVKHAYLLEKRMKELNKSVTSWYYPEYTHYFPPQVNRQVVSELTNWMKKQSTKW